VRKRRRGRRFIFIQVCGGPAAAVCFERPQHKPTLGGPIRSLLREVRAVVVVALVLYAIGATIRHFSGWSGSSIAIGVLVGFALIVARAQYVMWATRVAIYDLDSPAALEPFVRSWGQWLDERGRIVIRDPATGGEFEFRKFRFSSRPDEIVFRFRNADTTRPFFTAVREHLDREGVSYDLELTPKKKQPRALAVTFDAADVLTPLKAVALVRRSLDAMGAGLEGRLQVWIDGRLRQAPDVPKVELVNTSESNRQSFAFGQELGRRLRRLFGPTDG
jgi:hypothetical protein